MNRADIVEFNIGDIVYARADESGGAGMITGITHRQNGCVYLVTWGSTHTEYYHCAIELTKDRPVTVK